jgi:hypothetical protein
MTSTISLTDMKEELVQFLRNQDIFSTTTRNVATQTDTGTLTGATSLLINKSNVKNIRSITVATILLVYGKDFSLDLDYDIGAGVINAKLTFTAAQTGAYSITYDYGTDRIFGDFPKPALGLQHFPRIAVDFIGISTKEMGIGAYSNNTDISMSIYVYAAKTGDIDAYMDKVRRSIITNKKNFFYFSFITLATVGPTLLFADGQQKIFQRNIDIVSVDNIEEV